MVSDHGNVKSFKRKKERILHPTVKLGYSSIHLRKGNKEKVFYIHRLVAEAFLDNPKNHPYVNHINEVKNDNRLINLEWISISGNVRHGSATKRAAEKKSKAVIQYDLSGNPLKSYASIKEAAQSLNCDAGGIGNACRGAVKTALGYKWSFISGCDKTKIYCKDLVRTLSQCPDDFLIDFNMPIKDLLIAIEFEKTKNQKI